MADMELIVGVDVSGSESGFVKGLQELASKAEPIKVKVGVDVDSSSLKDLKTSVQQIQDSGSGVSSFSKEIKGLGASARVATAGMTEITKVVADFNEGERDAKQMAISFSDAVSGISGTITKAVNKEGELVTVNERATQSFKTSAQAQKEFATQAANNANALSRYTDQLSSFTKMRETLNSLKSELPNDDYQTLSKSISQLQTDTTSLYSTFKSTGDFSAFTTGLTKLKTEASTVSNILGRATTAVKENATQLANSASAYSRYISQMNSLSTLREKAIGLSNSGTISSGSYDSLSEQIGRLQDKVSSLYKTFESTGDFKTFTTGLTNLKTEADGVSNVLDKITTTARDNATQLANSASVYNKYSAQLESLNKMSDKLGLLGGKVDASEYSTLSNKISQLRTEAESLYKAFESTGDVKAFTTGLTNLKTEASKVTSSLDLMTDAVKKSDTQAKDSANAYKTYEQTLGKLESMQTKVTKLLGEGNGSDTAKTIEEHRKALEKLYSEYQNTGDIAKFKNGITELEGAMVSTTNAVGNLSQSIDAQVSGDAAFVRYSDVLARCKTALENYSAAERSAKSSGYYSQIKQQSNALEEASRKYKSSEITLEEFVKTIDLASVTVKTNSALITANGDATQSLGDKIGTLADRFASWFSVSQAIIYATNAVKQMISITIDLDTAMTELKKVTDETDATYDRFLDNAVDRAKELGATVSDTVTASADFARLGYNIDEAASLADAAIIYKNVGDGIEDISEASESIISTMQAFGIAAEDAMTIVDKFNEAGKSLPDSTAMC